MKLSLRDAVQRTLIPLFVLLFQSIPVTGQLSDSAQISVITCRAGDDIYNTFGHTAIRIYDPLDGKNELYNYGIFNFREPNFTMKFLRGKLLYSLGLQPYRRFLENYHYEKRTVFEQVLDISQKDRKEIYQAIRTNYKPENRAYLYDFFFDNCSTRPRDILLDHIDGVSFAEQKGNKTFRHLLDEYTYAKPWTDFGIDLIIGSVADWTADRNDQMFLPEYLFTNLEEAKVNGHSLVSETKILANFESELERRSNIPWFTPVLVFAILLLLELILFLKFRKKAIPKWLTIIDKFWIFILGIGSIIIAFMWFGTDHIATKQNLNLLWMHPLFLVILFKPKRRIVLFSIILMILAILLSPFIQELHLASILIILITILKLVRRGL
ncbi:MAG: DUF4105 domain-containing protein [Saprospiraceae bacterium]|nr:DUF4105 domain-containing protein [Saprospiraceae bacterium]